MARDESQHPNALQALLIGIDHHPKVPYIDLRGAVADVVAMRQVLGHMGVTDDNVRCLISPHPEGPSRRPSPPDRPTYSNLIREVRRLGRRASALGHHALLYFSGHGSRVPSLLPSCKPTDECLVPCDVGEPGARWLRDVELTYLLDEMLAAGVEVTCIVDACHGAGVTRRSEVLRTRRVLPGSGLGGPAASSAVASLDVLQSRWQAIHRRRTEKVLRSSMVDTGWLSRSALKGGGLTLLAACGQREEALEFRLEGTYRGGMSYYLCKILEASSREREVLGGSNWRQVHGRLTDALQQLAECHSVTPQHPILEGSQTGPLFPSSTTPHNRILVKSVDGHRLLLGAGEAWGLRPGDRLSTAPYAGEREAEWVVVRDVAAEEAWADRLTLGASRNVEVGEGLRWVRSEDGARHGVAIEKLPSSQPPAAARKRRVLRNGQPVTPPAAPDDQIAAWLRTALAQAEMRTSQWRVRVQDGRCQIQSPPGSGLADLPKIPVYKATDVEPVVDQLRHLNLWQHFWQLGSHSEAHSVLRLTLALHLGKPFPAAPLRPGTPLSKPLRCQRDRLHLLGLTLGGTQPMYYVILALGDDGSMTWLHPGAGSGEELEPGHRLWLRWIGRRPGRQRLKVIATAFPLAVSTWSLPPVEAAATSQGAVERNVPDPFPQNALGPAAPLKPSERFYFHQSHQFWTSAHLDVLVTEG